MNLSGFRFGFLLSFLILFAGAHGFSADDMLAGPWHHRVLSRAAAEKAGWTGGADAMAWHAERLDDYLYSPRWWAEGGLTRYRMSKVIADELERLHFDDLTDTTKVENAWQRYVSGTVAGLVWAKERNDVAAAHNIVGVSLHAVQDFFSHSNWVDSAQRRGNIYTSAFGRGRHALYTGTYEHPEHSGVKPHGKVVPECAVMNLQGISAVLEAGCNSLPMLMKDDVCEQYRACKRGETASPSVVGVKVPAGVVYYAPPGIALDGIWMADVAARERGVTDIPAKDLYQAAYDLAGTQSYAWLNILEREIAKVEGGKEFWERLKREAPSTTERESQFESLEKIPFTFLSAGPYPNDNAASEFYLRLRIKTSNESGAGTDSDIVAKAEGKEFVLDYGRRTGVVMNYNDFEQGDNDAYVIGPFRSVPSLLELKNNSATTMEIFETIWRSFVGGVRFVIDKIKDIFKAILGTEADHVATTHKVWTPEELAFPYGETKPFAIDMNAGGEGHYRVHGTLKKIWDDPSFDGFEVKVTRLECVSEGKWDRGSDSDEPFVLLHLMPLPGTDEALRTEPFEDVDSGENRDINKQFRAIRVQKRYGMLNLAVCVMEHDDESSSRRDDLLKEFTGRMQFEVKEEQRGIVEALGSVVMGDWKLEHLDVYAFSRNGEIQTGAVYDRRVDRQIKTRDAAVFDLDAGKMKSTGIKTADLITPPVIRIKDGIRPILPDIKPDIPIKKKP